MPLKPGDRVSLSLSCSIEIAKFKNLKPHATISRDFPEGADEETFLKEIESELRRQTMRQVLLQLDVENDLYDALNSGELDDLVRFCQKELKYVPQGSHQKVESGEEATTGQGTGTGKRRDSDGSGSAPGPVKKSPAKKG